MEIHLPDFVIAKLYKNNLVIASSSNELVLPSETSFKDKEINTIAESPQLHWLGENKRNISIVLNDADNVFIGEKELQFLSNILAACKFNVSDVAIINLAKTPANFEQIIETAKSRFVLLFGIDEKKFPLPQPLGLFENKLMNHVSCLNSPPLESMMQPTSEAKALKTKLWHELKTLFQLN